jgi:hypothetical protein
MELNIKDTFFSVLDDYKKYYVFVNKNPEVEDYQNFYLESKSQLKSLENELYKISKEFEVNIEKNRNQNRIIKDKLIDEKDKSQEYNELLKTLNGTEMGAKELINDTKELYNHQYYKNVELFIGILIVSYVLWNQR